MIRLSGFIKCTFKSTDYQTLGFFKKRLRCLFPWLCVFSIFNLDLYCSKYKIIFITCVIIIFMLLC